MHPQKCPLCASDAHFSITHRPNGKRFECPNCTEFWIDDYAENYLSELPEFSYTDFRQRLSAQAKKTAPEHLYVIREPKDSEVTGDGYGVARAMLRSEWIDLRKAS